ACLALQLHHVVDEPHRHAEVRRRGPVRMTFLDEVDYAPAKLDWMRPSHRKPPSRCHSKERESQKSEPGESLESDHEQLALGPGGVIWGKGRRRTKLKCERQNSPNSGGRAHLTSKAEPAHRHSHDQGRR